MKFLCGMPVFCVKFHFMKELGESKHKTYVVYSPACFWHMMNKFLLSKLSLLCISETEKYVLANPHSFWWFGISDKFQSVTGKILGFEQFDLPQKSRT